MQQQVAQAEREPRVLAAACDREQFLGEERVPLRAAHDRLGLDRRQRRRARPLDQGQDVLGVERSHVDHVPRHRTSDPVGEDPDAVAGADLVDPGGGDQEDRVAVDVMGQIDGQVDRGDVGPVHVLEHQEHWIGRRAFLEQRQGALEYSQR